MASGWGITGNKGRCYDFWVDFSECMSRCREPKDCGLLREDYFECLHHSKEVYPFFVSIFLLMFSLNVNRSVSRFNFGKMYIFWWGAVDLNYTNWGISWFLWWNAWITIGRVVKVALRTLIVQIVSKRLDLSFSGTGKMWFWIFNYIRKDQILMLVAFLIVWNVSF